MIRNLALALAGVLVMTSFCADELAKEPFALMDAAEFSAAMEQPGKKIILDARPVERYVDGHIKGAVNIFAPDLEKNPALLSAGKDETILVYCDGVKCNKETGKTAAGLPCRSIEAILPTKSGKAAMTVVKQGYTHVAVLYEGFPGWDLKGFPAYSGHDDSTLMTMSALPAAELKKLTAAKNDDVKIIDLRLPSAYAAGHVPGAVNMPYDAFLINCGSLDKNKHIVVYSDLTGQGHNAVRRLQKLGFSRTDRSDFAEWQKAGLPLQKK